MILASCLQSAKHWKSVGLGQEYSLESRQRTTSECESGRYVHYIRRKVTDISCKCGLPSDRAECELQYPLGRVQGQESQLFKAESGSRIHPSGHASNCTPVSQPTVDQYCLPSDNYTVEGPIQSLTNSAPRLQGSNFHWGWPACKGGRLLHQPLSYNKSFSRECVD